MTKKAQMNIGVIFFFVMYFGLWFAWLGGFMSEIGPQLVVEHGLTGFWAFFISNLSVWTLLGGILAMLIYLVLQ